MSVLDAHPSILEDALISLSEKFRSLLCNELSASAKAFNLNGNTIQVFLLTTFIQYKTCASTEQEWILHVMRVGICEPVRQCLYQ